MALGDVYWMRTIAPTGSVIAALAAYGLPHRHPTLHETYVWDDQGRRRPASPDEFLDAASRGETVSMPVWLDDDTDILVNVTDDHLVLGLSGCSLPGARFALATVLACAASLGDTVAVVADRDLPATEDGWLDFARGRRPIPYEPDLLALPTPRAWFTISGRPDSWFLAR